jgi:hypothetical protein
MESMDLELVRWGERAAPPRRLVLDSGPTRASMAGASLWRLSHGPVTVLCGLAVVVRDRNWGTVAPQVLDSTRRRAGERERLALRVRHAENEIDFEWTGSFELSPGRLSCRFDGVARSEFYRNRIGWCLLHPLELAGVPVALTQVDGGQVSGAFPDRISPHQPLRSIRGMRYRVDGVRVHIELDGDEFETEDQRNWTDASYKTYSTPLELPFPVLVRAGERISQSVTITMSGSVADRPPAQAPADGGSERIELGRPRPMPELGLGYPLGRELDAAERRWLSAALPDFLHVELAEDDPSWPAVLRASASEAARASIPLDVSVVAAGPAQLWTVLSAVQPLGAVVRSVAVFEAETHVSSARLVNLARELLPATAVGGGTRAHFAELNRATELPLERLAMVGYSISPQMHADDRASVRDNLLAQPATVRDAREIAAGRAVVVGPVGFRPRFNAVATGPQPVTPPGQLPASVDPRQGSVFGAAWTVGALAGLVDADRVVLYDAVGRRGVAARVDEPPHPDFPGQPGEPFPIWQVLAAVRAVTGAGSGAGAGPVEAEVALAPAGSAAVRLRRGDAWCLLVANARDEPMTVGPAGLAGQDGRPGLLLAADETSALGWSVSAVPAGHEVTLPAPGVLMLCTERIPVGEDSGG